VGLVLFTAVAGAALLRREGLSTLVRGTQKLDAGELPAQEMLEGLVLAVSGALLLTPGFATDVIGFAGLVPWSRRWAIKKLLSQGRFVHVTSYQAGSFRQENSGDDQAIEADFWREDKK
jgi:Protein affecting phage T7 exclusion by the F plasmid